MDNYIYIFKNSADKFEMVGDLSSIFRVSHNFICIYYMVFEISKKYLLNNPHPGPHNLNTNCNEINIS